MARKYLVLVTKTSALNGVYFTLGKIAEIASPPRAGIGTRSWPFCDSQANAM
jgi:hypothetical protein